MSQKIDPLRTRRTIDHIQAELYSLRQRITQLEKASIRMQSSGISGAGGTLPNYVRRDGTLALTADWDAGAFSLTMLSLKTDDILEETVGHGVEIDSVTLKDATVQIGTQAFNNVASQLAANTLIFYRRSLVYFQMGTGASWRWIVEGDTAKTRLILDEAGRLRLYNNAVPPVNLADFNAGSLSLLNNLTLGGTVDGVDIAGFKTTYDAHDHSVGDPTQVNHGSLLGLSGDDHPQYAQIGAAETITAIWTHNAQLVLTADLELSDSRITGIKQQAANPVLGDLADGEIRFVHTASNRQYVRVNGVLYYINLTAA